MPDVKCVLIHDNFQNFKSYNIPKAQLVIADIPYNIGTDFYASRPAQVQLPFIEKKKELPAKRS